MQDFEISAKAERKSLVVTRKDLAKPSGMQNIMSKKTKTVTTSGEHPTRLFATKKKKASMEFLSKTIESCKASCGIDTIQVLQTSNFKKPILKTFFIQDIKMNLGSDDTTTSSSEDDSSSEGKEKPEGILKDSLTLSSTLLSELSVFPR